MEQTTLEIAMVGVDEIVPYAGNAKIHTDKQIDHICNSIRDFGFNDPLGLWHDEDGACEVVYGHGTLLAAKRLGLDLVPCVYLDHMTDEQRREFCHIHNQTQLETGLDYDALTADMDNLNCRWEDFGFDGYLFNAGFDAIDDLAENDFAENATKSSGDTFNITFTFPSEHREQIEAYVKDVGKQAVVDEIVAEAVR